MAAGVLTGDAGAEVAVGRGAGVAVGVTVVTRASTSVTELLAAFVT